MVRECPSGGRTLKSFMAAGPLSFTVPLAVLFDPWKAVWATAVAGVVIVVPTGPPMPWLISRAEGGGRSDSAPSDEF